jgi:hypothetical protein
MHTIFTISAEDIQALNDTQARELIARLCRAELRASGASESAVTWGGDQRAKDGGVDVRVSVPGSVKVADFFKANDVIFQVKAGNFGPAKIAPEMAPKGKLREAIVELATVGGSFVIVSTRDSFSDSSLNSRRDAMADCLEKYKLKGKVKIDFYDSRKIADWVESHPTVVLWLKHALGKPLVGWRPYGPWAYKETTVDAEYLVDDRVKIFTQEQDEGVTVVNAIGKLRGDLSKNASVRIVGLSGVGKTRLAQALFDPRVVTRVNALEPENVIYTDLSDNPTPQPNTMLDALVSEGADCVIVVDNCGPDTHQRLTEIVKKTSSKLRLLTIEYDIRDDLPEATSLYRLEGSSSEVIKELLRRQYKFLSTTDLETIATFSDGNARIAFALASTSTSTDELGRLRDAELFRRLFLQKNTENDDLLKCAEAASLLYSFNIEDASEASELAILAGIVDVSLPIFTRCLAELQRRGLLQQRGIWRALLPHAIANRLAARAVEAIPKEKLIQTLVDNATDRVARSFSRRLGYLHGSISVKNIAGDWLSAHGKLGDPVELNELGKQIFANIAPIDQDAALSALERAVENVDFVSVKNSGRDHFSRIARSLAYDPELFVRASHVLKKFALAEPKSYRNNSSHDMLKSLFHCHLSGTRATPEQRRDFIIETFNSVDKEVQCLSLILLNAALEATHFSSVYSFDFGARRRDYGWWPRTRKEVRDWFGPFIELATEVGRGNSTELAREAKVVLGESIRGLITHGGMISELAEAAKTLGATGGWPEGWLGVRRVLQWDKASLSEADLVAIKKIEKLLAPSNLREKISAKVLPKRSFSDDIDDDEDATTDVVSLYRKAELEAEELGKMAAADGGLLAELLNELFSSNNSKLWHFGLGAGQESKDVSSVLDHARKIVKDAEAGKANLIFLRGFISGWHKSGPKAVTVFLEEALADDVWSAWFPELQLRIPFDNAGYDRMIKSIELGRAPTWQYRYLAMGGATDPLTVTQIQVLVRKVSNLVDQGLEIAIDLMAMVIHCANEKDDKYRSELSVACEMFLQGINWNRYPDSDDSTDHDMDVILEFMLNKVAFSTSHAQILENLLDRGRAYKKKYVRDRGRLLAPFFKYFPLHTLDAVYVPDQEGKYHAALHLVSDPNRENRETAIRKVSDEHLIEWCNISPADRYIFAANACRLFVKIANGTNIEEIGLAPTALSVLKHAPDPKAVLEIFIDRFQPSGWSGSLADILQGRVKLLEQLNFSNNPNLKVEIASARKMLEKRIADERNWEKDRERSSTGSFE